MNVAGLKTDNTWKSAATLHGQSTEKALKKTAVKKKK